MANRIATATKLSQNPALSSAHGSSSTTICITASHMKGHGHWRPLSCNSTRVASISTARCAGTPQPENTAYTKPSASPPKAAATGVGTASSSLGQRRPATRHSRPMSAIAIQANRVMWVPETTIRCVTPVMRKVSQCACGIAPWSPTTSAASTPAVAEGCTCACMRSRTHWRACCTGKCQP